MPSTPRSPRAGQAVYAQQCLSCHGDHRFKDGVKSGDRIGQVEDIDRIQTDRHRLDSYTSVVRAQPVRGCFRTRGIRFTRFRKTHGYANQPLDGIWLRGPYLHNGSVPTLRDLLNAPAAARRRRSTAATTCSIRTGVGFVSNVAEADGRRFTRYDTSVPGNGNMRARLRHDAARAPTRPQSSST